jgi:transcriptional regulator with XRE-family HTH domain
MTADSPIVRLGATITRLRKAAELSQKEFAAAVGMSQSLISRLEKGAQEPQLSKVAIIAEFFGLSLGKLLDGDVDSAVRLPEVVITRAVECENCGLIRFGMSPDAARQIQAEHRREHLTEAQPQGQATVSGNPEGDV